MNSLQIPRLAGQIYAMAGMQTKLHLLANEVGDYRGISANFSGRGFSDMKFTVHVTTQKEFEAWATHIKQSMQPLTLAGYQRLLQPSEDHPVEYYSEMNHPLFAMAMMKYMMPVVNIAENEEP
jgi:cytochrome o ubiquinol oxidase subunit 2